MEVTSLFLSFLHVLHCPPWSWLGASEISKVTKGRNENGMDSSNHSRLSRSWLCNNAQTFKRIYQNLAEPWLLGFCCGKLLFIELVLESFADRNCVCGMDGYWCSRNGNLRNGYLQRSRVYCTHLGNRIHHCWSYPLELLKLQSLRDNSDLKGNSSRCFY